MEALHSTEELIGLGREHGFAVLPRLVTDWISLGLLGSPPRKSLGRGKGLKAEWSGEQVQLLLLLLRKRAKGESIAKLAKLPVALWLVWGDKYVALPQVRRALRTWGRAAANGSRRKTFKRARELVSELASPDAGGANKQRLVELLVDFGLGQALPKEEIERATARVIEPNSSAIGQVSLVSADYATMLELRIKTLTYLDLLEDSDFERARAIYRALRLDHHGEPSKPQSANLDREEIINSACLDLITLLGSTVEVRLETTSNNPRE